MGLELHTRKQRTLDLENHMAHCIGTEQYYRYMNSRFVYTDGVREFAKKAEAYWFIDLCFSHLARLQDDCYAIKLILKGSKAKLTIEADEVVAKQNIPFTDCPEGEWLFYCCDNVLLWNGEY